MNPINFDKNSNEQLTNESTSLDQTNPTQINNETNFQTLGVNKTSSLVMTLLTKAIKMRGASNYPGLIKSQTKQRSNL